MRSPSNPGGLRCVMRAHIERTALAEPGATWSPASAWVERSVLPLVEGDVTRAAPCAGGGVPLGVPTRLS